MCYNKIFGGGLPCPELKRCSNGAQTVLNTDAQAVFAVIEGARGGETERISRRTNRGSAALRSVRLLPRYQNNNLGWCEAPPAVGHPRETEKPPGTRSGRRLRLETIQSPVERLFPPSGGVSRGSVRVGGETFLLPSYSFSFGYKRKGVSIAEVTSAQRDIVGQKICAP